MKNNLCFFGASVTQQKEGFAWHTSQLLNSEYNCFGYGGCHLKDAGICFIDKVLETK